MEEETTTASYTNNTLRLGLDKFRIKKTMSLQNNVKSQIWQYILTFNASLGYFFFGYMMSQTNTSIRSFSLLLKLDVWEYTMGIFTMIQLSSAFVGCLFGSVLVKCGRRIALMIVDIISIIGIICTITCLIYVDETFTIFSIGKAICGFAVGLNAVIVPLYIKEMCVDSVSEKTSLANLLIITSVKDKIPETKSGKIGTLNHLQMAFGNLATACCGLYIEQSDYSIQSLWFLLVFPIFPCLLRFILLLTVFRFDTPKYYVTNQRNDEALEVLSYFYKYELLSGQIEQIEKNIRHNENNSITYKILFTDLRYLLNLALILAILTQATGINYITFYSYAIFIKINLTSFGYASGSVIIINIGRIIGGIIAYYNIEKHGRKKLLLYGKILEVVALFVIIMCLSYNITNQIAGLFWIFYMIAIGMGSGCIIYIYWADILPEIGFCFIFTMDFMFSGIIGLAQPTLSENFVFDLIGSFIAFMTFSFFGVLFVYYYLIETKGKTHKQIWEELDVIESRRQTGEMRLTLTVLSHDVL